MRIGLPGFGTTVDQVVRQAERAEADGFSSLWYPSAVLGDPLVAMAIAGRATSRIELGTAVLQTYACHPTLLAGRAAAVAAAIATPGRLTIGVGPSHQPVIEGMLGLSYDHPGRHTEEYVEILARLLRGEPVRVAGDDFRVDAAAPPLLDGAEVPVLVSALAPRLLRVAGQHAAGTILWMANAAAIEQHVAPRIRRSAADAGRPAPRIVAGLPVAVHDDVAEARAAAATQFEAYGTLPNYRRILDHGGVAGPGDAAIVGDEAAVTAQIEGLFEAGATDVWAAPFPVGDDRSASIPHPCPPRRVGQRLTRGRPRRRPLDTRSDGGSTDAASRIREGTPMAAPPPRIVLDKPWTRLHDLPGSPYIDPATATVYPTSLEHLVGICDGRYGIAGPLHAAGTHYALSDAAVSDNTFIETNDPENVREAMARTLDDVVPSRLHPDILERLGHDLSARFTLVHIEAGKRIYQLYAELDQVDPLDNPKTLGGFIADTFPENRSYTGPWGFATLGSAGGQTVVGALNTGTHGGDFDRPPLADAVVAIHLVADGGKQWWIEPQSGFLSPLTVDDLLHEKYDSIGDFEVRRDDDLFNAVLVSAGRFGVIYSVVLVAVPQYSLYQACRRSTWQEVRDKIPKLSREIFYPQPPADAAVHSSSPLTGTANRFLQIAVCLTPHANFTRNLVGQTWRWQLPVSGEAPGRTDRVGGFAGIDPRTQSPTFDKAGASHAYHPPDRPGTPSSPTFLESACANNSFVKGAIREALDEISHFGASEGLEVGVGISAVSAVGGAGLLSLIPALLLLAVIVEDLLDTFGDDTRLAEVMNGVKDTLLDPPISTPFAKAAGLMVWQLIAYKVFVSLQKNEEVEAISYACMDTHDYFDQSCNVNVDSIEVFFDATDQRLLTFIDALCAFEAQQEFHGLAFLGYASLRFTRPTNALLGMQKHRVSCAVEISCLKDVTGGTELIEYASRLALMPNINANVHWGQRNDATSDDTERMYGHDLDRWRYALGTITDNGRLDRFSSAFTRAAGLEVVSPAVRTFGVDRTAARAGETVTVSWDATNNPAGSYAALVIAPPAGERRRQELEGLQGAITLDLAEVGEHRITIEVTGPAGPDPAVAGVVVTATER